MSGTDLVRVWKDPDARGTATHPAGEISLDDLYGGARAPMLTPTWETYCCDGETIVTGPLGGSRVF